jgi:hypothetical protein
MSVHSDHDRNSSTPEFRIDNHSKPCRFIDHGSASKTHIDWRYFFIARYRPAKTGRMAYVSS